MAETLDQFRRDYTPVAIRLAQAYKAAQDRGIDRLHFMMAIDPSIPGKNGYGAPGSDVRKALNRHKVYNRLAYLLDKIGRPALKSTGQLRVNGRPKETVDRSSSTHATRDAFVEWAEKYSLSTECITELLLKIMKKTNKRGELTTAAKNWLAAAKR